MLTNMRVENIGVAVSPGIDVQPPQEAAMFPRMEMHAFLERAQLWLSGNVKFTGNIPSGVLGEAVLMDV